MDNLPITAYLSGLAAQMLKPSVWARWDHNTRCTLASQISFCLALGTLGNRVLNNMPLLFERMTAVLSAPNRQGGPVIDFGGTFVGVQTVNLLSLTCLMWILRGEMGRADRNKPPKPQRLPLLDISEKACIPLPDGAGLSSAGSETHIGASQGIEGFELSPSWSSWLRSHVEMLIANITSGEWVRHTYSTQQGHEQSPSTHNVHFSCRPDPQHEDRLILSSEDGVDNHGSFRLEGYIQPSTGVVALEKHWVNLTPSPDPHQLRGAATPLGILGDWEYLNFPDFPIGFFWLFKRSGHDVLAGTQTLTLQAFASFHISSDHPHSQIAMRVRQHIYRLLPYLWVYLGRFIFILFFLFAVWTVTETRESMQHFIIESPTKMVKVLEWP